MKAKEVNDNLTSIGKGLALHKVDLVIVLATPEEVLMARDEDPEFAGSQEEVELERMVDAGDGFDYSDGDVLQIIEGPLIWVDGTALMLKVAPKP